MLFRSLDGLRRFQNNGNARYNNPEWGRFINADDYAGQTGQLLAHNVFAYCSNNPVMKSDTSGYEDIYHEYMQQYWENRLLYSAINRLPEDAKKKILDNLRGASRIIILHSTEEVIDVYDPNIGSRGIMIGLTYTGGISIVGYIVGQTAIGAKYGGLGGAIVGFCLGSLSVLHGEAERQEREDYTHSAEGTYDLYQIYFYYGESGPYEIDLRVQPEGYEWQPYSGYWIGGMRMD